MVNIKLFANKEKKKKTLGEKGNCEYLGVLEMKKYNKRILPKNEKISGNQDQLQISHQRDKHMGNPLFKVLGTILKVDKV